MNSPESPFIPESAPYTFLDRKSPELLAALATAPIFQKHSISGARPATPGERVVTTLSDGTIETPNTANPGDWVVTNPTGESHIVRADIFQSRYVETDVPGRYQAIGYCRVIDNPTQKPIQIQAEWGEVQIGAADCVLADRCDEHGEQLAGEPYIIARTSFTDTYHPV